MSQPIYSELHTHLLGMGDPDFWFTVITKLVPALQKTTGRVVVYQTHKMKENWEPREHFNFIDDLRGLTDKIKEDIESFNFRENDQEVLKKGVTNEDLNIFLTENNRAATLKKHFFCLDNSSEAGLFRDKFTPDFYPNRFAMKDDIYEVFPIVLSVLLLYCISSYQQQQVNYVEFSVSLKDLKNKNIKKYLDFEYLCKLVKYIKGCETEDKEICAVCEVFNEFKFDLPNLKDFSYYFLAGVNRSNYQPFPKNPSDRLQEIIECQDPKPKPFILDDTKKLLDSLGINDKEKLTNGSFIGFDLLGDEFLNPCNPFFYDDKDTLVQFIQFFYDRTKNPLGIRIHAGENLSHSIITDKALYSQHHKKIIYNDLGRCYDECEKLNNGVVKLKIRIGHGVAFYNDIIDLKNKSGSAIHDALTRTVKVSGIEVLSKLDPYFEWCPISNQTLLPEYHWFNNLQIILEEKRRLVVASDNSGILLNCTLKDNISKAKEHFPNMTYDNFTTTLCKNMKAARIVNN